MNQHNPIRGTAPACLLTENEVATIHDNLALALDILSGPLDDVALRMLTSYQRDALRVTHKAQERQHG